MTAYHPSGTVLLLETHAALLLVGEHETSSRPDSRVVTVETLGPRLSCPVSLNTPNQTPSSFHRPDPSATRHELAPIAC